MKGWDTTETTNDIELLLIYPEMVQGIFEKITFGISVEVTQWSNKTHVQRSVGDFSGSFNIGPS